MLKIAIIGAGVAGLSQYLFLRKVGITENHHVKIYEARDSTRKNDVSDSLENLETYNASVIGASIGLAPTGLKVLKRLDCDVHDEVLRSGHVVNSWKISTARGWTLATVPAGDEEEIMVMIGREAFWRILKRAVPESVIVRKKVRNVEIGLEPTLLFPDGSYEEVVLDGRVSKEHRNRTCPSK